VRRVLSLEWAAAAFLAASVASPLGVGPDAAAAADAKVDLTGCLAPGAAQGDTRVFETNQEGAMLTETVLDVGPWKDGDSWTSSVEAKLGSHTPTVRETFVKPGKKLLLGDLSVGDLEIDVGKPERWLPLEAVPGRPYRASVKGKALRDGQTVGKAVVKSDWEIVGFEPLTTPGGSSYPDAVHIAASRQVEVRYDDAGTKIRQESDVELWCVDGVGIVAASYGFRFFENDQLVDELDDLESWLVSATVDGVAVN
jgi:hypothetical protein